MARIYTDRSVLDSAVERVAFIFDHFDKIVVSVSSGKDSTAIYHLVIAEAQRRNRKVSVMFLDQEAEYEATVQQMEHMMAHPNVIAQWYQVPVRLTNATSFSQDFLHAWGEGECWMREKHPLAIHRIDGEYPQRFYDFFYWLEQTTPNTAFIIGLRAEESLNRLRSVIKNPGFGNVLWSTKTKCPSTFRFYPIYDWGMGDVWKYIHDNEFRYNAIYDKMLAANHNFYNTMRVSNLIHEKSFTCLTALQELEPETYDRLIARIGGVHVAALYAKESTVFTTGKLPGSFSTWREYRDYLLITTPLANRDRFIKRFDGQRHTEHVFKQQCRQLLLNDFENSLSPIQTKVDRRTEALEKWRAIL